MQIFESLKNKNYRLFYAGFSISLLGIWIRNISIAWIAYQITGSAFFLSLISVAQLSPLFFFSILGGIICDKFSKRRIIFVSQTINMIAAIILGYIILKGVISYSILIWFSLAFGIVNAFDFTARQSIAQEIAGSDDTINAVSLNTASNNLARLLAPLATGYLLPNFPKHIPFFINAVCYTPYLISLSKIKDNMPERNNSGAFVGFKLIFNNIELKFALLIFFFTYMLIFNFNVLLPVVAKVNLGGTEVLYSILLIFLGVGAIIGALITAKCKTRKITAIMTYSVIASVIMASTYYFNSIITVALSTLFLSMLLTLINTGVNGILQNGSKICDRGRIMSIFTLSYGAAAPIGSLIAGGLTNAFGASMCYLILGICCLIVSIFAFLVLKRNIIIY